MALGLSIKDPAGQDCSGENVCPISSVIGAKIWLKVATSA
jgi:hypothetical protein